MRHARSLKSRVLGQLGLGLAIAACSRSGREAPPPPRPPEATATAPAEGSGPSVAQIAEAIDPGPRPALTVELPPWLADALGVADMSGDASTLLAASRAELERFEGLSRAGGGDAGLPGVVALARALALAERAGGTVEQAPVEVLLVLEKVYRLMDMPVLARDRNVFGQMLAAFAATLTKDGQAQDSEMIGHLAQLVRGALQGAGPLHRRTVAALLRTQPDHPDVPQILGRLGSKIIDQDEALAVGVLQRSLSMRGTTATAAHWLDLAVVCHRALDVSCGREALARAEALAGIAEPGAEPVADSTADAGADEALTKRLHRARTMASSARRAVELRDAAGLDDRLERGRALADLQRFGEARALFEQLMRHHPDDARPVVGLAKVVLSDGLDFMAAAELVDRAAPRDHLDRDWYELTIGVRATMLIYYMLPQLADRKPAEIFDALRSPLIQIRADIEALEQLGADEGRVLRFAYDLGMEAWPKSQAEGTEALRAMTRTLLARTRALAGEVPGSLHAYTLMLAAAEFSEDRRAALAVLDVEPPAEHAEALASRRALAALDLVAAWDAAERVPDMLRLLDAIDGEQRPRALRRAVIDGHVIARRLGRGQSSWAELERRYRALLGQPGAEADALLLNNLAVVVAEQGRSEQALALWTQAEKSAKPEAQDLPRLNARAVRLALAPGDSGPARDDRAELQRLARDGKAVEVRLLAQAWLVATASGSARRKAERALRRAAADEAAKNFRPRNLPGRGGVILRGTVQVGLSYSSIRGMELELDMVGVPWLVAPCPVAIPDPRAR
ncbi:MAG: hypothetical protein AAGF11_06385 [Myxococcota bacterium]